MVEVRTRTAFATYRTGYSLKNMHEDVTRYEGDADQISAEDGLEEWRDGNADVHPVPADAPIIDDAKPANRRVWVVTPESVLHAPTICPFGDVRQACEVKHSNLTGGRPAYAGGECLPIDDHTIVLNGSSGRYRISTEEELNAVALAFCKSGYFVWSMGWSEDVDRPAMFGTQDPVWIAP